MIGSQFYTLCTYLVLYNLLVTNLRPVLGITYSSYQPGTRCTSFYPFEYPNSIQQVQQIVQKAITLNTTVKALGSRHSVLDLICTDGIPIDMHKINYIQVDKTTAKVGAGTELADFIFQLEKYNRALSGHVPSFGGVTIGGALGTGARGSSLLHKTSLSDQIMSVTVVDGNGRIHIIDEASADFSAFRVNLGLLGVIIDVSFRTVPAYKMQIENYETSDSILLDGTITTMARKFDWLKLWWFPSTHSVVVSKGSFVSMNIPGNASTYMIPDMDKLTVFGFRNAYEKLESLRSQSGLGLLELLIKKSLYQQVPLRQPVFSEDGLLIKNPAIGYVHNLMQNRCTKCSWSYGPDISLYVEDAFALDFQHFESMIKSIQNILSQYTAFFPIYGIFIRFSPASDALMSIEYGRETVHIEIVTPMRVNPFDTARAGLAAIQAIEQSMVFNFSGRPHFSMCGLVFHTKEMVEKYSPNIARFRSYLKKYDPNGIFMNKFGFRITGKSNEFTIDSRVKHCALQDYCFCKLNTDCASSQVCQKLNGFNVCKDSTMSPIVELRDTTLSFFHSFISNN